MKVLLLSHSSGSQGLGGAEITLLQLIDAWKARTPEVKITVVARNPRGSLQAELDARTVDHESLDFGSWVRDGGELAFVDRALELRMESWATQRLVDVIRERQPDLVVTNTIVSPWAAIAARLCGVPHVWLLHEFGDLDHGLVFRLGREETLTDVNLLSDLVVANSLAVRDSVAPWITEDKLTVSYPAIDIGRVRRLAASPAAMAPTRGDGVELRTVMVGRLSHTKGQWRLIRAVAALRDEGLSVEARLIGLATESDHTELARLAAELGVSDRVHFVGETDNPFAEVAAADVGVMASNCEAFGRVTVEYMALGRPVIAIATGANPELISDGQTGWLVGLDDQADLVRALREACARPSEVDRRGENARRWVDETFTMSYPVDDLVQQLERVAEAAPQPIATLPTVIREWLDFPREVESYLSAMHESRRAGIASAEWRVGRALTFPARVVARLLREGRQAMSRSAAPR